MKKYTWSGNAKLTYRDVCKIRKYKHMTAERLERLGEHFGVHLETIRRIYTGRSWKLPYTKRLPEEWKKCKNCGAPYKRTFPNGRRRTPAHWKQKVTCSRSCAMFYKWATCART